MANVDNNNFIIIDDDNVNGDAAPMIDQPLALALLPDPAVPHNVVECPSRSPATQETFQIIKEKYERKKYNPNISRIVIRDNTELRYNWLLPGWVCEERTVDKGRPRVYRYYYDPAGNQYDTCTEDLFNA
ncbi:hypothetical protein ACFE04_001097 [Oxalis oulophora]